jgi:hypothetical protein
MTRLPAEQVRALQRLALAGALVVIVGFTLGLDAAMAVVLLLAVIEFSSHLL